MANFFTDTMPINKVQLGHFTVSKLGRQPDEGKRIPQGIEIQWDEMDVNYETALQWHNSRNPTNVILGGEMSMKDFKTTGMGNETSVHR